MSVFLNPDINIPRHHTKNSSFLYTSAFCDLLVCYGYGLQSRPILQGVCLLVLVWYDERFLFSSSCVVMFSRSLTPTSSRVMQHKGVNSLHSALIYVV